MASSSAGEISRAIVQKCFRSEFSYLDKQVLKEEKT